MDIWAWVNTLQSDLREAGQGRIADLIDSIPDDTYNSHPERVLAALPEAIAAARALKNPWLEIFFRHWGLNNRLSNRGEGEVALSEAVSLIEFAHRDDHRECPQSVCVTQDIAICYRNIDGPGWAPDILAVCEETLARINPQWPCFCCISREYAEALLDADRPAEAVTFLDRQAQAMTNEGDALDFAFEALQARALWKAGQSERALMLLAEVDRQEDADGGRDLDRYHQRATLRATIQAERGEFDLAVQSLPAWSELIPSTFASWAHAASVLALHFPGRNTWQLGRQLQACLTHFSRVGAHFDAVKVGVAQAKLALERGAPWTARRALALAQAHLPQLRVRDVLGPRVAELDARLRALPARAPLPVPAAELVEHLRQHDNGDPEQSVEWLLDACAQRPDDPELAEFAAAALSACGAVGEDTAHLRRFVQAHPLIDAPLYRLMSLLLERGATDELARLADELSPHNPQASRWIQAQCALQQKQWARACEHLSNYVRQAPAALGARRVWAQAALKQGDLATALELCKALTAESDSRDDQWDLLTVASASQDWVTVRSVCAALDIELEGDEGLVDAPWGVAYLRFEEGGDTRDLYARRTGPVTARIVMPSQAPHPQHLNDWVAFDAAVLEPSPQDEEERAHFIPTFRAVHVIEPGGFGESCFVDGAAPSDALFNDFANALKARGWHCAVTSMDDYRVTGPDGEPLRGMHFAVTAPSGVSAREIDRTLRNLTALWPHPMCWPGFAGRAGLDVSVHMEVVARYGL